MWDLGLHALKRYRWICNLAQLGDFCFVFGFGLVLSEAYVWNLSLLPPSFSHSLPFFLKLLTTFFWMPKMKRKDSGPAVLRSDRVRALSPAAGACMCDGTLGGEVRAGWGWAFSQGFVPRKVKKHWLWYESYQHSTRQLFPFSLAFLLCCKLFLFLWVFCHPPHPASPLPSVVLHYSSSR